MGPIGYPEMSVRNYHCITSQKTADITYIAAEARNHTTYYLSRKR